jgi:hypothetical protein
MFNGVNISITGSSGSAVSAISATRSALGSFERSARSTADAVEQLGDQVNSVNRSLSTLTTTATASALSVLGLRSATVGASSSLITLGAGLAAVTSAVVVAGAALAPLVVTLGGLVAGVTALGVAFSSILGLGFLAFGEQLSQQNQQQLEQTRARIAALERLEEAQGGLTEAQRQELQTLEEQEDRLEDATSVTGALGLKFVEVGQQIKQILLPAAQPILGLARDTIEALPALTQNILDAIGPLDTLASTLRRTGEIFFRLIPIAAGGLFDIARNSLVQFNTALTKLANNTGQISNIIDAAGQVTARVFPLVAEVGEAFLDLVPSLTRFGVTVLSVVLPALASALRELDEFLEFTNTVIQTYGGPVKRVLSDAATIAKSTFAPAVRTAKRVLKDVVPPAEDFESEVRSTAEVLQTVFGPVVAAITGKVGLLADLIRPLIDRFRALDRETQVTASTGFFLVATNAGLVASALGTLGTLLGAGGSLITGFGRLIAAGKAVASFFVGPLKTVAGSIGGVFLSLGGRIKTAFAAARPLLAVFASLISGSVVNALGALSVTVASALGTLGSLVAVGGPIALLIAGIAVLAKVLSDNRKLVGRIFDRIVTTIQNGISDAAVFLRNRGATLVQKAFKFLGEGLRIIAIDIFNFLTGSDDSVIGDVISGLATYLKNDALGDLKEAFRTLVTLLSSAATGFINGLLGPDETLKSVVGKTENYLKNQAKKALKGAVKSAFSFVAEFLQIEDDAFKSEVKTAIDNTIDYLFRAGLTKAMQRALTPDLSGVFNGLNDLIDLLNEVGNAIDQLAGKTFEFESIENVKTPEGLDGDEDYGGPDSTNETSRDRNQQTRNRLASQGQMVGLDTGGFVESGGIAMLHSGERVVPEAQVSDRGPAPAKDVGSGRNGMTEKIIREVTEIRIKPSDEFAVEQREAINQEIERITDRIDRKRGTR